MGVEQREQLVEVVHPATVAVRQVGPRPLGDLVCVAQTVAVAVCCVWIERVCGSPDAVLAEHLLTVAHAVRIGVGRGRIGACRRLGAVGEAIPIQIVRLIVPGREGVGAGEHLVEIARPATIGVGQGAIGGVQRHLIGIGEPVSIGVDIGPATAVVEGVQRVAPTADLVTVRVAPPIGVGEVRVGAEVGLLLVIEAVAVEIGGCVHHEVVDGVGGGRAGRHLVAIAHASAVGVGVQGIREVLEDLVPVGQTVQVGVGRRGIGAVDEVLVAVGQTIAVAVGALGIGVGEDRFLGVREPVAVCVGPVRQRHVVEHVERVGAHRELVAVRAPTLVGVGVVRVGLIEGCPLAVRAEDLLEIAEAVAVAVWVAGIRAHERTGFGLVCEPIPIGVCG